MIKNIKGAIFDMDGTLVNSLIVWDVLWRKLGEMYLDNKNFKPTADDDKKVRTMTLKECMYYIHNTYDIADSGEELFEMANNMLLDFYANEVMLKDGVLEFLEYCYKNNIKMCIASATDKKLLAVAIEHCKIGKYFDYILSCADIGKGKEHPDIYLNALECLGTKKEETCVFEDSLVAVITADKAGLKTVGIYDVNNYGHEEMKRIATEYVDDGETLLKLI